MKLFSKRGQSTGEYAILFAIVLGAVFAVQGYIRNRVAGNIKASVAKHYFNDPAFSGNAYNINQVAQTEQRSTLAMEAALKGLGSSGSLTISETDTVQ